jgi:hypothetical protein
MNTDFIPGKDPRKKIEWGVDEDGSTFIRVQKSSEFVGATRRVARTEFEGKGDKALFLTLGTLGTRNFRHFLTCVYPRSSVSHLILNEVPNEP